MGQNLRSLVVVAAVASLAVGCGTDSSLGTPDADEGGAGTDDVGARSDGDLPSPVDPVADAGPVDDTADGPSHRVIGYFTSWSIYAPDYHVSDIPADKLTHVTYAFANISQSGECVVGDAYADIEKTYEGDSSGAGSLRGNFNQLAKLKEQHPHLKALISIGGWVWSGRFSDVVLTAESRQKFVASCVDFMQRYGFDGIDINWEHPVDGGLPSNVTRSQDKQNYTLLLAEFRRQLDQLGAADGRHYLLTIVAPPGPGKYAHLELGKLPQYLDWISLTTYDFHGPWNAKTNFNAPLYAGAHDSDPYNVDAAVQAFLDTGVPADKIVVGVPFFGRGFKGVPATNNGLYQPHSGVPEGTRGEGIYDWGGIADTYLGAYNRHWHQEAKAPWLYDAHEQIMITYDDPESLAYKVDYVHQHGLGGVMIWELSADDAQGSLVDALQ
jgi:chitinase